MSSRVPCNQRDIRQRDKKKTRRVTEIHSQTGVQTPETWRPTFTVHAWETQRNVMLWLNDSRSLLRKLQSNDFTNFKLNVTVCCPSPPPRSPLTWKGEGQHVLPFTNKYKWKFMDKSRIKHLRKCYRKIWQDINDMMSWLQFPSRSWLFSNKSNIPKCFIPRTEQKFSDELLKNDMAYFFLFIFLFYPFAVTCCGTRIKCGSVSVITYTISHSDQHLLTNQDREWILNET